MQLFVDNFDRIPKIKDYAVKFIFSQPRAHWLCKYPKNLAFRLQRFFRRCNGAVPTLVLYNIPHRDLGSFSAGGLSSDEEYLKFVKSVAVGIGTNPSLVILEPDAIPHAVSSENPQFLSSRISLLGAAASILRAHSPNARVYLDVGHPRWLTPDSVIGILSEISGVHGVSLNVSNFVPLDECMLFGNSLGVPYVIDTSRNGNASYDGESDGWCNPPNRKLGSLPRTFFANRLNQFENLDAFLWVKIPGESDGECNGGPKAGKFWYKYAKELVK